MTLPRFQHRRVISLRRGGTPLSSWLTARRMQTPPLHADVFRFDLSCNYHEISSFSTPIKFLRLSFEHSKSGKQKILPYSCFLLQTSWPTPLFKILPEETPPHRKQFGESFTRRGFQFFDFRAPASPVSLRRLQPFPPLPSLRTLLTTSFFRWHSPAPSSPRPC